MEVDTLKLCYNKGCGKKFNVEENNDGACTFHPGVPVFHDALKGWSCCKKRSTDFTDFLHIPGCTNGSHNPEKPLQDEKLVVKPLDTETVIVKGPPPLKIRQKFESRPDDDLPLIKLKVKVASSLLSLLSKLAKEAIKDDPEPDSSQNAATEEVKIGTPCKNHGCEMLYSGPEVDLTTCQYHPGAAIFHDGYKFWSCCQRRTSDFNEFQRQEGCAGGDHVWVKPYKKSQASRLDWYQMGSFVVISVFAKACLPDQCTFEANATKIQFSIQYDNGLHEYEESIKLHGVIDPTRSSVELLGTKVEIKLRKADLFSWSTLTLSEQQKQPEDNSK